MDHKYKVGGYVKLAKLWERSKDAAVAYHSSYYAEKFRDDADKRLVGVYIDITGNNVPKKPRRIGGRWSVLDRLHIKQAERRQKDNTPQQEQERSRKS